jgi:putative tricarboxylic transport membrane protein
VSEKTSPSGLIETGIGAGLAALGLYFATASWRLPAGPDPSAPGPGVAPGILGVMLALFGVFLTLKAVLAMRRTVLSDSVPAEESPQDETARRWIGKPAIAIALLVASALLLEPLGFMLSTFGFLVAGFIWLGDAKFWPALSAAAVTSVTLWLFFTKLLGVGLPFGRLVEILFY